MNSISARAAVVFACLMYAIPASAQDQPQVISIPLSLPGEPVYLEISLLSAHIEVIGEDRQDAEFSIQVERSNRSIVTPSGTQSVAAAAYSLEVDEDDNHISVDTDWRPNKVNIVARIPRRADLELSTTNDGEILVSNISGNLQLENTNGPITATNINGSVIAETINENIDISFSSIDDSDPMALISMNGDISIGIPDNAGAQFHIDSAEGEIYSDFEVEVQPSKPIIEQREDRGGIEVRVESVIVADVNGGGSVIKLKTLNGGIQIRKSGN